jgi:hypothetical protein
VLGAIEILGIKLAGDKGLITELGPLLLAGAATAAAWLAAGFARTRQREQLAHDSERQREQLAHDSERQREQLRHDRELRNGDHSRNTLDDVIRGANRALRASIVFRSAVMVREGPRNEQTAILESDASLSEKKSAWKEVRRLNQIMVTAQEESHVTNMEMRAETWRLRIRFGRDSEIASSHEGLAQAFGKVHRTCAPAITGVRTDQEKEAGEAAVQARTQAFNAFTEACESWIRETS